MSGRLTEGVYGGLLLIAMTAGGAAAQDAPAPQNSLLLGVVLNGREAEEPVVALRQGQGFLIEAAVVRSWRLLVPGDAIKIVGGERYVALSALPGVDTVLDGARQVLRIQASAEAFEGQRLVGGTADGRALRSQAVNAAFLSYNLALQNDHGLRHGLSGAAFLQAGASGEWGLFTSTQTIGGRASGAAVRLETTYVKDDVAGLRRLSLGDALSAGSAWVQPIRFAGLRYGTAFDLQPSLVTFPTPAFFGRTAIPSEVELYVNDVLRYRGQADAGPFSIAQAPLVTGAGQVSLQVRDGLGVQHTVNSSYYASPTLLKPDLGAFSLEAGVERRGYGLVGFEYGPPFVAAGLRRGITDWVTLEGRIEAGAQVRDLGLSADVLLADLGEATFSGGVSTGQAGSGAVIQASFSRITPSWSVSASFRHETPAYRAIGIEGDGARLREQAQLAGGATFGRFGQVTLAYTQLELGEQPRSRVASVTYSLRAFGRAFLSFFVLHSHVQGQHDDSRIGLSLTVPFGRRGAVSVDAQGREQSIEVRSTPTSEGGVGARAFIRAAGAAAEEGDLTYRGAAGEATLQAAHTDGGVDVRLLVSGAVVVAGGRITPTRQLNGGFALVETPGLPDVQVFAENRPVARTDRSGRAIVTDLRPYEANRISIDPGDLPIEASLSSDVLTVSPATLGGVRARFEVGLDAPATIVLRDPSGAPLAAGLPVRINGGDVVHVGFDGEVFAPNLQAGAVIEAQHDGATCRALAPVLPAGGGAPRLDPVICHPMEARP